MIELTNMRPADDSFFSAEAGWFRGDPPEGFEVPGWTNLHFFSRVELVDDGGPGHRVDSIEYGVIGDSVEPVHDGKRVRSSAVLVWRGAPPSGAVSPEEWIAEALLAMARGAR